MDRTVELAKAGVAREAKAEVLRNWRRFMDWVVLKLDQIRRNTIRE
jgi:hypothetical protein